MKIACPLDSRSFIGGGDATSATWCEATGGTFEDAAPGGGVVAAGVAGAGEPRLLM
jgi:hypothetical protein